MKVAEQLELSFCEAVNGAEIHIEGNESFSLVPYPIPPLLPNVFVGSKDPVENAILTAKLNKDAEIENIISLHSKFEISDSDNGEKSPLFALFAWNKLRCVKSDKNESVRLSIESRVLCDFTSYVAVSENVLIEPVDVKKEETKLIKRDLCDEDKLLCCFSSIKLRKVDKRHESPCLYDEYHEAPEMKRKMLGDGNLFGGGDDVCYSSKKSKTHGKKGISIFDDLHDKNSEEFEMKSPEKKGGLFDDDDDICYDSHERKTEEFEIKKPKKKGGLFYDDDDICYDSHERKTEEFEIEKTKKKDSLFDDDDKIASNDNYPIREPESDSDKIWDDDSPAINIIRLQSRDGFWDLPSSFVIKKNSGQMLLINEINLNLSPILKKRIVSTVFTLAYLKKFHNENPNKWKFAIEKGVCWLKMIVSANWLQIIEESMKDILK